MVKRLNLLFSIGLSLETIGNLLIPNNAIIFLMILVEFFIPLSCYSFSNLLAFQILENRFIVAVLLYISCVLVVARAAYL